MFQILIVEDDKELSQLFQKVLEKNGYQVKSASDGAQALEVLDKEYIDLIISDIMMPVMDGYELVSELRSAGYQIPVLMITAKGSFDDMRQGFLSGSDDYMVKPVNVNEMVLRVGALLRRAQILNEHKIVIGSTEFDYDAMTVTTDKESLVLPKKEFLLFRESAMGMDLVRYASDYLCFKIADRCIDALRYFRMASPQYLREPFKKFLF